MGGGLGGGGGAGEPRTENIHRCVHVYRGYIRPKYGCFYKLGVLLQGLRAPLKGLDVDIMQV